jgi:hypothetical protein
MSQLNDLLDRFVAFSAQATGFSAVDLWGTGQAGAYLATVRGEASEPILRDLLDAFETAGDRPGGLDGEVFGDAKVGPLARNIIKLWYSGVWYELPAEWAAAFGAPVKGIPAQRQPDERHRGAARGRAGGEGRLEQQGRQRTPARPAFVVSPAAYTEGLMWRAVGAHPAGAKAPGYASWTRPPDIDEYKAQDEYKVQQDNGGHKEGAQ